VAGGRAWGLGGPPVQHRWFEKPRRLQRAPAVCVALMCGGAALAIAARDDHASASALIGDVQKSPQGAVAGEPLGKAKGALARAADARAAGEFARAEMLEALAQEWAETARDLVRVAEVDRKSVV